MSPPSTWIVRVTVALLVGLALRTCGAYAAPVSTAIDYFYTGPDSAVTEIYSSTFDAEIGAPEHAGTIFVVEFYAAWCGHCQAFRPKFELLATDLRSMRPVVVVAAVGCHADQNKDLCNEYDVRGYPSLRIIQGGQGHSPGQHMKPSSLYDMRTDVVRYVAGPGVLPQADVHAMTSEAVRAFQLSDRASTKDAATLVVAKSKSAAYEIWLSSGLFLRSAVKVVYAENANIVSNMGEILSGPFRQWATPQGPGKSDAHQDLTAVVVHRGMDLRPVLCDFELPHDIIVCISGHVLGYDPVDVRDVVSALYELLMEEVAYHVLDGPVCEALVRMLGMLQLRFPYGPARARIAQLTASVDSIRRDKGTCSVSRPEWSALMSDFEVEGMPVTTGDAQWAACAGSEAEVRGYTCGLWTLFHALVANADGDGPYIISVIRDYATTFFMCTECSEHFVQYADMHAYDAVSSDRDARRWLWRAHNDVNLRLRQEQTVDSSELHWGKQEYPRGQMFRDTYGDYDMQLIDIFLVEEYAEDRFVCDDDIYGDNGDAFVRIETVFVAIGFFIVVLGFVIKRRGVSLVTRLMAKVVG